MSASPPVSESGQHGSLHPPFVGRDDELRALEASLERMLAGAGQIVLLAGEPGIGKTRVTEQFAARSREHGAQVLWGSCYEWEGAPAYWPWSQALRACFHELDDDALRHALGPHAAFVAQVVPEIHERLAGIPPLPPLEPEARLFRLLAAVAATVRAGASDRPIIVILDDIHWADKSSLLLLRFLAQDIRDARVLLVATYRNAELGRDHPAVPILADLARESHCRRIVLRGLSKSEVERFVTLVTGRPQAQGLVDTVFEETTGNPFFVTEIVRLLADEGALDADAQQVVHRVRVPENVREAVGRRLARLSPGCNLALTVGAVIGREFDVRMIEHATGVSAIELLDALDEAVQAQLVGPGGTPTSYRFSHALVQETLYQEVSAAERARLHLAVGSALEAAGDREPPWAELAHHFYQAGPLGDPAKIAAYAEGAGYAAMEQFAWEAAAGQFQHALDALDLVATADPLRRCDLLLAFGTACNRCGPGSGDSPAARERFLQAFRLARELGEAERMARAAVDFAGLNIVTAFGGARQLHLLEEALAALDPADSPLRVRVLSRLAVDLWNRSTDNHARSRSLSDEAVAAATRLGDPALVAFALWAHHYSGWRPDNLGERLALVPRMIARAEQTGDPVVAAWGYISQTLDCVEAGDLPGAEEALAAMRRFDASARIPYVELRETVYRGMLELLRGNYASAEQLSERARELWQSETARQHQIQSFVLLRDLSRLDELGEDIRLPDGANLWRVASQAHRMALALERGQIHAARADYEALVADDFANVPFDAYWFGVVVPLAEAACAFDDAERAGRLYDLLAPYADRVAFVGILGVCHGPVALYLGQLATALGRWDAAEQRLTQALAMAERLGMQPYVARGLLAQAELHARRDAPGDRKAARELTERASDAAAAIGMAGLLARRVAPRDTFTTRHATQFSLTARELEVLRLVAGGLTDVEVAERLFLSPRTVGTHLTSIYTKLNVNSRVAATRVAIDHALV